MAKEICYLLSVPPQPPQPPRRRRGKGVARGLAVVGACVLVGFVYWEMQTSSLQSRPIAWLAAQLHYDVEPGASPSIRYPAPGPYDQRLGYSRLPEVLRALERGPYRIESQARPSEMLQQVADFGLFPIYREKTQAGLSIMGCDGSYLAASKYPQRVFADFAAVPPLVVQTLLYIENRELLDERYPYRNPAVEWDRLGHAAVQRIAHLLMPHGNSPGGSTLATQIEKYRHSPGGRTNSMSEKLRQMASASLRAYMNGADTYATRQQIVLDYLNTMPLSATQEVGEVFGLGDGLWAWYGADLATVSQRLRKVTSESDALAQGRAYRQVLSLLVAQRRPSGLLWGDRKRLADLTDSYLRLMAQEGIVDERLRDAALAARHSTEDAVVEQSVVRNETRKVADTLRSRLSGLLGVDAGYDLDRFDLKVETPISTGLQREVNERLRELSNSDAARAAGLIEERLLARGDPAGVTYSLILFERTAGANLLRVQADSIDQPFDVNDQAKLDLGSTSKLRTLLTYLEIIAELHGLNASASTPRDPAEARDPLTRWALEYLAQTEDHSLLAMLNAALERHYSANPGEAFFTGGGVHRFANFDKVDDNKIVNLREALRQSINLPFIRLMRDIVHYEVAKAGQGPLDDDEERERYLMRFADNEGDTFLRGFYNKHRGSTSDVMVDALAGAGRKTPQALALIFRTVYPEADAQALSVFLSRHLPGNLKHEPDKLFVAADPGGQSLNDRAYLARVHPLELWLAAYFAQNPGASWREVRAASHEAKQASYEWLFKTRHRSAQDQRIRIMREAEAFKAIHARWKRVGYPFETLVPSYATAIGSSADRPAALAELMGIVVNDGWRLPSIRIDALHFATATPYETRVVPAALQPQRVLAPEIAQALRPALLDVVANGTARRLGASIELPDGQVLHIGGKTGTGDNRFETFGSNGQVLTSRAVSRAATFVFMIGDRFFGTVTAYVPGAAADNYSFTSALPVQVLKTLKPIFARHLGNACGAPDVPRTLTEAPAAQQDESPSPG